MSFSSLADGNKYYSQLGVNNWHHSIILADGCSLASDSFLTHTLMRKLMNTWGKPSAYSQGFLSVYLSSLQSCVLENLAILVSLESHLCLLNSGNFQAPPGLPLPVLFPGNSLKIVNCGNLRVYLICFLSLRDHCPSLPKVHRFRYVV